MVEDNQFLDILKKQNVPETTIYQKKYQLKNLLLIILKNKSNIIKNQIMKLTEGDGADHPSALHSSRSWR